MNEAYPWRTVGKPASASDIEPMDAVVTMLSAGGAPLIQRGRIRDEDVICACLDEIDGVDVWAAFVLSPGAMQALLDNRTGLLETYRGAQAAYVYAHDATGRIESVRRVDPKDVPAEFLPPARALFGAPLHA